VAFLLPALPKETKVTFRLPDRSSNLSPITGAGSPQRILRPGRFGISVEVPALEARDANVWLAAQLRHITEGGPVRLLLPVVAVDGLPAGAQVDGAGQAGSLLAIKGLAAGQVVAPFTPFSFVSGGVTYLHRTSAETTANGAGKIISPIGPMLRVSPANSLALNFTAPNIEGNLDDGGLEWTLERLRWIGFSFSITER